MKNLEAFHNKHFNEDGKSATFESLSDEEKRVLSNSWLYAMYNTKEALKQFKAAVEEAGKLMIKSLRFRQFYTKVRMLVNPDEFSKFHQLLFMIDSCCYDDYIACLKYGYSMESSFRALEIISDLTRQTALSSADILSMLPRLRLLDQILTKTATTNDTKDSK